ncbi:hypothetical protein A6770_38880 [Nostoc minutum NIES-26]|uniref:Uncharacterized protein n=1 Tax=Nostoc minutum NIES-26 TaxID=1844469 RepID=A0A367RSK6_9NOSO|nr:hypothetical protein A6770_38880 [Nostoc minutum NIES-26]
MLPLNHSPTEQLQTLGKQENQSNPTTDAIAAKVTTTPEETRKQLSQSQADSEKEDSEPIELEVIGDYLEENQYIGTWGETFGSTNITAGERINRPSKTTNETEDGFATFDDAVAYAHISIVSQKADGGVIVKIKERYYAYTIKVAGDREFSRKNLEEGLDTLKISKNNVEIIQALITTDGYTAPPTEFQSNEKPAYIVKRDQAGKAWQSTTDPKESGYQTILQDLAEGRDVQINEQGYVALFRGLLKAKALKRLEENRQRLEEAKAQYSSDNSKAPQNLKYLYEVIKKDQQLEVIQTNVDQKIFEINRKLDELKPKQGETETPSRNTRLGSQTRNRKTTPNHK